MNAQIIDIYETTNENLKRSGIITKEEYIKIFCLYIKNRDELPQTLYFGWAKGWDITPLIEGETIEHYDDDLHHRIEQFAWKYRELLLNGVDIREVINMDKENILEIYPNKNKTFKKFKSMFKKI